MIKHSTSAKHGTGVRVCTYVHMYVETSFILEIISPLTAPIRSPARNRNATRVQHLRINCVSRTRNRILTSLGKNRSFVSAAMLLPLASSFDKSEFLVFPLQLSKTSARGYPQTNPNERERETTNVSFFPSNATIPPSLFSRRVYSVQLPFQPSR